MNVTVIASRLQANQFEFFNNLLIPRSLGNLTRDGSLTGRDILLLHIVHSLEGPGIGGNPTNRYLARSIGVTHIHVSRLIKKLNDLGLLGVEYVNCVRRLTAIGWDVVPRGRALGTVRLCTGLNIDVKQKTQTEEKENTVPREPRDIVLKSSNDYSGCAPLPSSNDGGDGIPSPPEPDAMLIEPIAASTPKSTATEFDHATATRLRSEICKAQARTIPYSRTRWADEIRKLRESLSDGAESRITQVLDWYVRHIGKEYIPVAFSAEAFRRKFDQIEAAAKRAEARTPTATITDEARSIVKRLTMKQWPTGSGADLATVVQLSLNNYRDFLTKVRQANPVRKATKDFQKHILDKWRYVEDAIQSWFTAVWDRLKRWKDWNGSLAQWVWRFDRDEVTAVGRSLASRYTGMVDCWDDLKSAVKQLGGI